MIGVGVVRFGGIDNPNQSKTEEAADEITERPAAKPPTTGKTDAADAMLDTALRVEEMVPWEAFLVASDRTLDDCAEKKVPGAGLRARLLMAGADPVAPF